MLSVPRILYTVWLVGGSAANGTDVLCHVDASKVLSHARWHISLFYEAHIVEQLRPFELKYITVSRNAILCNGNVDCLSDDWAQCKKV